MGFGNGTGNGYGTGNWGSPQQRAGMGTPARQLAVVSLLARSPREPAVACGPQGGRFLPECGGTHPSSLPLKVSGVMAAGAAG